MNWLDWYRLVLFLLTATLLGLSLWTMHRTDKMLKRNQTRSISVAELRDAMLLLPWSSNGIPLTPDIRVTDKGLDVTFVLLPPASNPAQPPRVN